VVEAPADILKIGVPVQGMQFPEILGYETGDVRIFLHDQRQHWRLHPAYRP
jgi:hypothetical protein